MNPSKKRFNSFSVVIPVEFDSVFSGLKREDPVEVLKMLSRESIVKLASLLKREYCGEPVLKMVALLSNTDSHFMPLYKHLSEHTIRTKQTKGADVVVAFDITPLELLRIAFSIEPDEMRDVSPMRADQLQWRLTKVIAQINQRLMDYTTTSAPSNSVAKLLLVNDASYKDIHKIESKGQFIIQPIQAIRFFQLLESKPKYEGLLNAFYEMYGITSWKEYVKTIYSLSLQCFKEGIGIYTARMIEENTMFLNKSVLEKISIDANNEVIPYACSDEYDDKGNSDYKEFKGRPLFKLRNGDYVVHNQAILLDRLFQGLYFDFLHLAKNLEKKHPDVAGLFTSDFIEKTLFASVVKDCLRSCKCFAYDEEDLMGVHRLSQSELGYPDFFVRSKSNKLAILFECKDIRMNAWVKEQRDYELLERELKNKIVRKNYKQDRLNKRHEELAKPRKIGVGQLAGHTTNIRKGQFPWVTDLPPDVVVYPVLVIADNRLIYDGLPLLAQQWYYECLESEGLTISAQDRPLIMMSPLTFIKYKRRFKAHGFAYYFEKYYEAISVKPESMVDLFNKVMSFDTFMEQYAYSLQGLRKDLMKMVYER